MIEDTENQIYIGSNISSPNGEPIPDYLLLSQATRHGMIAGATGTGKTITLQILAENLSKKGVPVFCTDIKGDLAGLSVAGTYNDAIVQRAAALGLQLESPAGSPVIFWDIFGKRGRNFRASPASFGAFLFSRLLDLSAAQLAVLNIAFKLAADKDYEIYNLEQLKILLEFMQDNLEFISSTYGAVTKISIGAVRRELLNLELKGGAEFLNSPSLDLDDLMLLDEKGRGFVNILDASELIHKPQLYATLLFWLLTRLFIELPEVGEVDKPRLVCFFDEAHLLFSNPSKELLNKIEQIVRLIRSKGVGVYFITQNPMDIAPNILGQLGNRVQHALRAYSPNELKAVRSTAKTFRQNPEFDTYEAIIGLKTGEALVSLLDRKSMPSMANRTLIRPPISQIGAIDDSIRWAVMSKDPIQGKYNMPDNNEVKEINEQKLAAINAEYGKTAEEINPKDKSTTPANGGRNGRQSLSETATKTIVRNVSNQMAKYIVAMVRDIIKNMFRSK